MARLSLATRVPTGRGPARLLRCWGPFARMMPPQPAFASSMAANDPPAPLQITIALVMSWLQGAEELEDIGHDAGAVHRVVAVGPLHLGSGVAAWLDVAGEADLLPAGQVLVAPVLWAGVQALDGVLEQQAGERADRPRGQDLVLFLVARCGEFAAGQLVEVPDSLCVLVLPGDDALAPGEPGHRVERGEPGHQVGARRVPVAPRAAGEEV